MFEILKTTHVATVVITASLFLLRGYWMLTGSALLRHPVVRIAPHVNDTVLLASALGMVWLLGLNPLTTGWLAAKLIALVVYILLGTIALKRGPTLRIRVAALVAAVATLGYIVGVAYCRTPLTCLAL